jgi:hypothetical protein
VQSNNEKSRRSNVFPPPGLRVSLSPKDDGDPRPIRCLRDVVDLPPGAFALPGDGRQAKHLRSLRKDLAVVIARYANPDGSGAYPAVETLTKATGQHRATVFRLLSDLRALGFLSDGKQVGPRGSRMRVLNVVKMRSAVLAPEPHLRDRAEVASSHEAVGQNRAPESHLHDLGVASSHPEVASSRAEVSSSRQTQPLDRIKTGEQPGEAARGGIWEDVTPAVENPPPYATNLAVTKNPQPSAADLAKEFCQDGGIPQTSANLAAVAAAITAESTFVGLPLPKAAQELAAHVTRDRDGGVSINRFYFEDAKWRNSSAGGSKAIERSNRVKASLVDTLRRHIERATEDVVGKCPGCGRPRLASSSWTEYCADSCRDAHRRSHCRECDGTGFRSIGPHTVTECDHVEVQVHRPPASDHSSVPEPKRQADAANGNHR